MKQEIQLAGIDPKIREFILLWKKRKKYISEENLSIGECIELLIATNFNLHSEESDGRFFNHNLINEESSIQWDGEELIEILLFELLQSIRKRLNSGTFNEEVKEEVNI